MRGKIGAGASASPHSAMQRADFVLTFQKKRVSPRRITDRRDPVIFKNTSLFRLVLCVRSFS